MADSYARLERGLYAFLRKSERARRYTQIALASERGRARFLRCLIWLVNVNKALLEEWLSTRSTEKYPVQDRDKLIGNLKTIQDYLCSFKSQGYSVVNISATAFPQTLDWLHSYLLQCIEQGTSSVSSKSVSQSVGNQVTK